MKTIKSLVMLFVFYYTLMTLVWLPWCTCVSWNAFVSSEPAYFIGGIISIFMLVAWHCEKEEKV